DPFFTTKEVGSGSGLGLSMVQGFALQSGGAVQIRSKPGRGTTVELWLPRAGEPPATAVTSERSEVDLPPSAGHILLCDDDDDVRRFLCELLESDGYTIHEASSPEGALRTLNSSVAVDLLVVDYAMPGINGMEIIWRARQLRPGLKALLITGHAGAPGDEVMGI